MGEGGPEPALSAEICLSGCLCLPWKPPGGSGKDEVVGESSQPVSSIRPNGSYHAHHPGLASWELSCFLSSSHKQDGATFVE